MDIISLSQIHGNTPFRRRIGFFVTQGTTAPRGFCSRLPGRLSFCYLLSAILSIHSLSPHCACALRVLDEWQATPPTCPSTMTPRRCPTFPPLISSPAPTLPLHGSCCILARGPPWRLVKPVWAPVTTTLISMAPGS